MSGRIHIMQVIETGGCGGAEMVLLQLARSLPRDRYVVSAGVARDAWLARNLRAAGVRTAILGPARGVDPRLAARLSRVIRHERVDLVHGHLFRMSLTGCLAARIAGVPAIATVHGTDDLAAARRRLGSFVVSRLADRLVPVSHYLRSELTRLCRVPPQRMTVIHNGVVLEPSSAGNDGRRREVRDELGLGDQPLIGAVGGLRPIKGHRHLLDAMAKLLPLIPTARLVMVGQGALRGELESRAQALGISDRVQFLGLRDDVARLLTALDCFVLPSLSEGLSIATIEAMAAGVPVVVTDSGGPTDIVTDGVDGLVVPPANADALAAAVARVLQDRPLARQLGEAARARVKEFDLQRMIEEYDQLYQEVLRDHRRT